MHAAVEEVDLDPCDLYTDLGTLIVEGRVPGLTDKGFGEGPHCPRQNRHQCDPSSPECQKYDQILKHMLLLWKNGIPMTIEVLLYPNCCSPSQNVESVPDMAYVLLEQWTIHMLPRRVPDASIHPRGLIQAVRSFLYFSQLCAWYSLTGGKSPKNIHYRVCVPGEAFSSKFSSQPDSHVFPVANVGRNSAMKVQIKCHPRCGEIPLVPCHKHSSQLKTRKCEKQVKCRPRDIYDGVRTSSPGDAMLGESLLDPPNDLCMYPKRYQSPSRCGSPSIEVPEHLMFGAVKESSPPRRSRPQRRPVVERFLKSDFNPEIESRTYDKRVAAIKTPETVLSYCCIEDVPQEELEEVLKTLRQRDCKKNEGFSHLIDDMTIGSNLLEQQNKELKKGRQLFYNKNNQPCDGLSHLMGEMNMRSNLLEQQQNKELKKNSHLFYVNKQNESCDSKSLFKQALRLNKESSNRKYECAKNLPPSTYEKFSEVHRSHTSDSQIKDLTSSSNHILSNRLNKLGCYKHEYAKNYDKLSLPGVHKNCRNDPQTKDTPSADPILSSRLQSPSYCVQSKRDRWLKQNIDTQNILPEQNPCLKATYLHDEPDRTLLSSTHLRLGSVNIKKYGALLSKGDTNKLINDERAILDSEFPSTDDLDEISPISYIIPSAEKKALFRRSLDSATSLVFHQRSGLPLTSSPAPVRKSGTCFDFDSSLTTVSAIKRALFEKEVEEKSEEDDAVNLSNSAPASIVSSSLLGTFEESVLNGRLEPVSTVEGFTAEIGASGSFCPRHITLPVTVFFYTLQDMDKVTSPYMGHINLRDKDYHIPKKGTVQVTLFNPHGTVVKMFVVRYDLSDMPVNCQTFLRQRTLYMPQDASENDPHAQKWLRYLIHLRFMSSKSGRIYLHTDVRVIIFRKSDLDAATVHGQRPYELRSFTHGPLNPKFSTHKPPLPCT